MQSSIRRLLVVRNTYRYYARLGTAISHHPSKISRYVKNADSKNGFQNNKSLSLSSNLNSPYLPSPPVVWFHPVRGEVVLSYIHKFFDTVPFSRWGVILPLRVGWA